jgi:hypothetical protein
VPNGKGADYTVVTDTACEIGAAWNKSSGKTVKAYISARLDSPFLPNGNSEVHSISRHPCQTLGPQMPRTPSHQSG